MGTTPNDDASQLWACPGCFLVNAAERTFCGCCGCSRPHPIEKLFGSSSTQKRCGFCERPLSPCLCECTGEIFLKSESNWLEGVRIPEGFLKRR